MNIAVLGAGAMGCLFGAKLWESGQQVILVDVREDHVAAINELGLAVDAEGAERIVRVPASLPAEVTEPPELILLFTKAFHTESALAGAKRFIGPDTWILSLQNGLGHQEIIEKFVDRSRIVVGTTTFPSDFAGPGRIHTKGSGATRIMTADGVRSDRLEAVAAALDGAGLNCQISEGVQAVIWEKVAFNAALNCLTAVTGLPVGGVGGAPEGRALAERVVAEALEVARKKGLAVNEAGVQETVGMAFRDHGDHKPSMLQDLLAGRPTEVGFINGAIVREAKALGVEVPVTETLGCLVKVIEAGRLR
jgi:2-dehydropantoate 2-reductase